jgi:hypothetical protein
VEIYAPTQEQFILQTPSLLLCMTLSSSSWLQIWMYDKANRIAHLSFHSISIILICISLQLNRIKRRLKEML